MVLVPGVTTVAAAAGVSGGLAGALGVSHSAAAVHGQHDGGTPGATEAAADNSSPPQHVSVTGDTCQARDDDAQEADDLQDEQGDQNDQGDVEATKGDDQGDQNEQGAQNDQGASGGSEDD